MRKKSNLNDVNNNNRKSGSKTARKNQPVDNGEEKNFDKSNTNLNAPPAGIDYFTTESRLNNSSPVSYSKISY